MSLRWLLVAAAVAVLFTSSWADRRRDPLTEAEILQLREAAQDPETRLKLFVTFARTRLTTMEQLRSDPKTADRGEKTHDALQDFLDIYDELNDNIDTFVKRNADLRKSLPMIIQADGEFESRLRALKSSVDSHSAEASEYEFLLTSALESVETNLADHKELLEEQQEQAKHKKK
ncbi:MAG TPA: hypothetical protein VF753_08190 [Terriglobales bacterium]